MLARAHSSTYTWPRVRATSLLQVKKCFLSQCQCKREWGHGRGLLCLLMTACCCFSPVASSPALPRTQLRLESLEDTHIIKGEDDALSDKHGCPAYVSPEILNTTGTYSGKSADVWSLGVMLYTLLVGRYPFHDSDPSTLFSKIRRGQFCIPDHVSPKARCLIRSLLRREPSERLTAPEILLHPWFEAVLEPGYTDQEMGTSDQIVPEYHGDSDDISSFFC